MKLIALIFLLGFAAADLLQDAAPVVEKSVSAFLSGASKVGALSEALGFDDPILDQLSEDIEEELAKSVLETFQELLQKIQDNVDNGKAVGRELLQKVKELRQKLKELGIEAGDKTKEALQKIREKAKEALKKILERLGVGRRNMDDSMDQIARMDFRVIVEKIKEKLTSEESLRKLRSYVARLSDTPVTRMIQAFFAEVPDSELREILDHLLDYKFGRKGDRAMGETWDKVKEFFKELDVKIQDRSKRFGEWVRGVWGKGLDKLKAKYGSVKAIAMEFIANAKDMTAETAREALEFFQPYQDDLGTLWQQIVDATKEAVGRF